MSPPGPATWRADDGWHIDVRGLSPPAPLVAILRLVEEGITNAINLIDGLDGLAGGVAVIVSLTMFAIASLKGDLTTAMMALQLQRQYRGCELNESYKELQDERLSNQQIQMAGLA